MTKVSFPLLPPEEYLVPYKVVLQWWNRRIVKTSLITRPFFSLFHMQTASCYNIFFKFCILSLVHMHLNITTTAKKYFCVSLITLSKMRER